MSGWDRTDWFIVRPTGPRREPPARCYQCGEDVPDTPRFGNEATCDRCLREGHGPVDPWLVDATAVKR